MAQQLYNDDQHRPVLHFCGDSLISESEAANIMLVNQDSWYTYFVKGSGSPSAQGPHHYVNF